MRLGTTAPITLMIAVGCAFAMSQEVQNKDANAGAVLSILYFENTTKSPDFDWLRSGLSDMLTTDIVSSGAVTVVERERLAKVLEEQELQLSGVSAEDEAVRVGAILAATKTVYGSFVAAGQELRIEAYLVDTKSAAILAAVRAQGRGDEVLDLERKIAAGILTALGIQAQSAPTSGGTSVAQAAAAYYQGLAALDTGAFLDAAAKFRESANLDPSYAKPQSGLEAAYRFLKDFKRQREQHELAGIAASLQKLRSRLGGRFYGFADMISKPQDFGFTDVQAASAAYSADPRGYSGDNPVQAMWNMQTLLLEMGQKSVEYFDDGTLADRCDEEIVKLASIAQSRYPNDPFLAETQYMALFPLKRASRWADLKSACERMMTTWPDYRMAWAIEDMYQAALDKLSGKE